MNVNVLINITKNRIFDIILLLVCCNCLALSHIDERLKNDIWNTGIIHNWTQFNNATYKEVWGTLAGKWFSLISEF